MAQKIFWCSNGIRTHDLRDTGAMLYQLNYEASNFFSGLNLLLHNCEDHFHLYSLTAVHLYDLIIYTSRITNTNTSTNYGLFKACLHNSSSSQPLTLLR